VHRHVDVVIPTIIPLLGLRSWIKRWIRASDFSLAPLHGMPSPSLQSWVIDVTELNRTSSDARSILGKDGSGLITRSIGCLAIGFVNEQTGRIALNFRVWIHKS
jgi:hypothetical protein